MNPWPVDAEVEEVHTPRPGHADLAGPAQVRPLRRPQRARARERPRDRGPGGRRGARQGAPARLRRQRPQPRGADRLGARPRSATISGPRTSPASTSRRCAASTPTASEAMVAEIDRLRKANESLGGIFEVRAFGLVPGLGSHSSWEERLDARLAQALVSIQAVKGVSVGEAWEVAGRAGSESHDEIFWSRGARLAPRDQPRRRRRGRDVERRAARRARRAEADLDPDQAAALAWTPRPRSRPRRCASAPTRPSCPAAGVVGEAMIALVLARLLPREVRRRPHRRRARRARPPTGSGSGGGGRGAARPTRAGAPAGDRLHRLHGRGQDDGRERRARRRPAGDRGRRAAGGRARHADRRVLRARRRGGVPQPRGRRGRPAARGRRRRRDRARRRRRVLGAGPQGARPPRRRLASGRRRGGVAARRRAADRPLAQDRERFEALYAEREPIYEAAGRRDPARRRRGAGRRALPALSGSRELPPRDADGVGVRASRASTRSYVGAGILGAGLLAARGPAVLRHRHDRVAALRRRGRSRSRAWSRSSPASAPRRSPRPSGCCASWRRLGMSRADHLVALGGGVVGDLAGFCAADLPARGRRWCRCRPRWSPRSTPRTAARPGSTCPRPRTTSAPTTCRAP